MNLPELVLIALLAQHNHDPELHEKFYQNLVRPDNGASCCNKNDCYVTQAMWRDGGWWALRREDQKWLPIPSVSVLNVKNPDGQAHLCAPKPGAAIDVYCFVRPEGSVLIRSFIDWT